MAKFVNQKRNKSNCSARFPNCPSEILNTVPSELEKLQLVELNPSHSFENKAIIGKICNAFPLGRRANGSIRKLVVSDALSHSADDPMRLAVFLLNQWAQDSEAAEVEGYIILSNFIVENSTHHREHEFSFQVLVQSEESQVWFAKRRAVSTSHEKKNGKAFTKRKKLTSCHQEKVSNHDNSEGENEDVVILHNHYNYVILEELTETDPKNTFNVYGIVEKCDLKVLQGKRTQILDLVLTDESLTGFICSVFAAKDETFPDIYPGDIIRIHRMQVYKFRSRLKGKCPSSKFILVFSKSNQGSKPRTVAKSFTFTSADSEKVKNLFEWYNKKSDPKLMCELQRDDFANIVCQVIGVYVAKHADVVVLKVWDATKSDQLEGVHLGFPTEKLDEKLFLIARKFYVNLSVYGEHSAAAGELEPGQFIEVCNAHLFCPKNNPDDCKLCLHTGSKEGRGIHVLDQESSKALQLTERISKVVSDIELGNETDDLLSENNSVFLNIDFSALPTSQAAHLDECNIPMDVESLNQPLPLREENISEIRNTVIAVSEAAVLPGQSTQEFGESSQNHTNRQFEDNISSFSQTDPAAGHKTNLNATPMELKSSLHNPPIQQSPTFFPISNESEEDWWTSVVAVSVTDNHSEEVPSTLADIVKHDAPRKFRTLSSVLSFRPNSSSIGDFIHLICPSCFYMSKDLHPSANTFVEQNGLTYFYCPECSSSKSDLQSRSVLKYTYLIALDLHDGSGPTSVEVFLWRESAVKFFKDITPEQSLKDSSSSNSILQMLWSICPNCRPFHSMQSDENRSSDYPILDCCLLSYQKSSGVFYQVFDTKLL